MKNKRLCEYLTRLMLEMKQANKKKGTTETV